MKTITLDTVAKFTYGFGNVFHLETALGNFEWKDPDYPFGDNTIKPCEPYKQWCKTQNIPYGRCKGTHTIQDYCGAEVKFL